MVKAGKFLYYTIAILLVMIYFCSCCTDSNQISSEVHEDSFDWFSIYKNGDPRIFLKSKNQEINDTTTSIFLDTINLYSEFEFHQDKACHHDCSPICQEIFGTDELITLDGIEENITFSIRNKINSRWFKFKINNSGELIDSLKVFRLNDDSIRDIWIQLELDELDELTLIRKDTIHHNSNVYNNCFKIIYKNPVNMSEFSSKINFCKMGGVLSHESSRHKVTQNDSERYTETYTRLN